MEGFETGVQPPRRVSVEASSEEFQDQFTDNAPDTKIQTGDLGSLRGILVSAAIICTQFVQVSGLLPGRAMEGYWLILRR